MTRSPDLRQQLPALLCCVTPSFLTKQLTWGGSRPALGPGCRRVCGGTSDCSRQLLPQLGVEVRGQQLEHGRASLLVHLSTGRQAGDRRHHAAGCAGMQCGFTAASICQGKHGPPVRAQACSSEYQHDQDGLQGACTWTASARAAARVSALELPMAAPANFIRSPGGSPFLQPFPVSGLQFT